MTAFSILCVCHILLYTSYASSKFDDIQFQQTYSQNQNDYSGFSGKTETTAPDNETSQYLRDQCCNRNDYNSLCTSEKCYFVLEEKTSFLTSRTACSKEYVKWQRLADAATFQKENEFIQIKQLLSPQTKYWTGGISCPVEGTSKLEFNKTWINGQPIPKWLATTRSILEGTDDSCLFLTLKDGTFNFENETNNYTIICELKVSDGFGQEETTETSLFITEPTTTSISTQTGHSLSTSSIITSTSSDQLRGKCEERTYKGIIWPATPGGEEASVKCPKGTVGTATWHCDSRSNEFISEPNMMECVSEWFKDIEQEITAGKDGLYIANKLVKMTKDHKLIYGDLPRVISAINLLNKNFHLGSDFEKRREYGKGIVQIGSNLLKKKQDSSWNDLDKSIRLESASNLLLRIQAIGRIISCKEQTKDEDITSDHIRLQSFTFRNEEPCIFPRTDDTTNRTSYVEAPSGLKILPSTQRCSSFATGYGVLYDGISPHLSVQEESDRQINSVIISFSYGEGHQTLNLPPGKEVSISLKHTVQIKNGESRCVFWNFTRLRWEDTGCYKVYGNLTHTLCRCSHLTNFAVLMDISGEIRRLDDPVMKYLSIVCCGLSSIALIFTIACLIGFRASHSRRSTITCNLAFCLLVVNLLVLFGIKRTEIEIICRIISGALHYSALASFCWMLLEGYHLYQMVIVVFEKVNAIKLRWFCISAYGVPLLVVIPSVILRSKSYGDSDACFLSAEDNMMWVFAGPIALILLINVTILIMALKSARNVKMKKQQTKARNLIGWIKGSFSLMSLLGITWIIGFANAYKGIPELGYVFIILNGLQGCFIMVFHVIINEKVRGCFIALIMRSQINGRGFRHSLQTTTSSRNPLHSQRKSESMYFSNPRRISVSPASTTFTGHM